MQVQRIIPRSRLQAGELLGVLYMPWCTFARSYTYKALAFAGAFFVRSYRRMVLHGRTSKRKDLFRPFRAKEAFLISKNLSGAWVFTIYRMKKS